jgi:hypothetical protein
MCPGGNKPSGTVSNNKFLTCPSAPAIFANPSVKGCADGVTMSGNQIDGGKSDVSLTLQLTSNCHASVTFYHIRPNYSLTISLYATPMCIIHLWLQTTCIKPSTTARDCGAARDLGLVAVDAVTRHANACSNAKLATLHSRPLLAPHLIQVLSLWAQ